MQDIADIWREYKRTGDASLKDQLVEHHLPLVRNLAVGILRKLRPGSELDDLIADGNMGLVRAIEGFDISRGFKFQTYATPVVRGAIYNGLRRMDWLPERTRTKTRQVQQAIDKHQAEFGEAPSEAMLAELLKVSTEEVYDLIASLSTVYLLSLDQPLGSEDEGGQLMDVVEDDESDPAVEVEFGEERDRLREAIKQLNEREQLLVTQHYFEGVTFEAISRELGVSKQRVSQMHTRAVQRLREFLGDDAISSEAMQGFTFEGRA